MTRKVVVRAVVVLTITSSLLIAEAKRCNKEYFYFNDNPMIEECQPCYGVTGPCYNTEGDCLSDHPDYSLRNEHCLQVCPEFVLDVKFPRCVNSTIKRLETANNISPIYGYNGSSGLPDNVIWCLFAFSGFLLGLLLAMIVFIVLRYCRDDTSAQTGVDRRRRTSTDEQNADPESNQLLDGRDEGHAREPETEVVVLQRLLQPQERSQEVLDLRRQVMELQQQRDSRKNRNWQLSRDLSSVEEEKEALERQLGEEREERRRLVQQHEEDKRFLEERITRLEDQPEGRAGIQETGYQSMEKQSSMKTGEETSEVPMTQPPSLPPMSREPNGADSGCDTPIKQTVRRGSS